MFSGLKFPVWGYAVIGAILFFSLLYLTDRFGLKSSSAETAPMDELFSTAFDLSHSHRDSSCLVGTFGSMALITGYGLVPIKIQLYGNTEWRVPNLEVQWGYSILVPTFPGFKLSSRTIRHAQDQSYGIQLTEMRISLYEDTASAEWKSWKKLPY